MVLGFIQCCGSESGLTGSLDPYPDSQSGSGYGSRRAKMTHKRRKKLKNFIFRSAQCSLLRAEKKDLKISVVFFSSVFLIKPWIRNWIRIRIRIWFLIRIWIHLKYWIQIRIRIQIQLIRIRIHTETSSLRTLKIMTRNLNEIVCSWIRLLVGDISCVKRSTNVQPVKFLFLFCSVHYQKIIHRDIKPSNLLRADSGEVSMADHRKLFIQCIWAVISIYIIREREESRSLRTDR